MTTITKKTTVRELVVREPQIKPTLESLGIDYCCGGWKELAAAAREAGAAWSTVRSALEQAISAHPQEAGDRRDVSGASPSELADYIVERHHAFLREHLPRIAALFGKVARAHGRRHGQTLQRLRAVFETLRAEIQTHMLKEEQILFPYIHALQAGSSGDDTAARAAGIAAAGPIQQMEYEHEKAGAALVELAKLSGNYLLPDDACASFADLYEELRQLTADLHEHIHLENNILFPKTLELETAAKTPPRAREAGKW